MREAHEQPQILVLFCVDGGGMIVKYTVSYTHATCLSDCILGARKQLSHV